MKRKHDEEKYQPKKKRRKFWLGPYVDTIKGPCCVLVTGKCGSGKTTLAVRLIEERFSDYNRYFAFCPSFLVQDTFHPIRGLFRPADVFTEPDDKTMKYVVKQIIEAAKKSSERGLPIPRTLILIDDLSGNSIIQGRRIGVFSNFVVQYRHWNVSFILMSQQPKCVDSNYRDNCFHIIAFPSDRKDDEEWIQTSYSSSIFRDRTDMKQIIRTAWQGGLHDKSEIGSHFLYIYSQPRGITRFFVDFNSEINV